MKKMLMILTLLSIIILIGLHPVEADMGPKPSIRINVIGMDDSYYFDLLIEDSYFEFEHFTPSYMYYKDDYPDILKSYDEDGFVAYSYHDPIGSIDLEESGDFIVDYYAPHDFKLVLVNPDNDALIISEYIEVSRFESSITWDVSDVDLSVSSSNAGIVGGDIVGGEVTHQTWFITAINTVLRVLFTLLIELGLFYAFMYRGKIKFLKVGLVNVVTQLALSIILISTYIMGGSLGFILLTFFMEFIVFFVEYISYCLLLKEETKLKLLGYTLVANFASFVIGLTLIQFV